MAKKEKNDVPILTEKQLYPVPVNWRWVKLYQIAEINMGQSPAGTATTDDSSYMPLIGGAADMGPLYPETKRYTKIPTKVCKKGDIILCIRATLGQPIYSDGEYCLGRGVAGIRPQIGQKEYYWYAFINFERYLYDNATGSTFAQVTSDVLKNMPMPLPPLAEQHRIVDRIETIFAKLDEAKEKAQAVIDGYQDRKAAILHRAFTGELTEEWRADPTHVSSRRMTSIKSLCTSLQYGTASKSIASGKVAVIRMGNLRGGEIDWTNLVYSDNDDDNEKYRLFPGDVLFNRTNSAEHVGKTSIYRGEYPAIYAGYLIKLDYDHSLIIGDYLNYLLNTPEAREYCNLVKTDAVNQSNINAQKIGAFDIPLVGMDEQQEIVQLLDTLLPKEAAVKEAAETTLETIDIMKQSILARAFRGALGTNDPNDEPAEELLKRILSE